jgi:hypothetical protein
MDILTLKIHTHTICICSEGSNFFLLASDVATLSGSTLETITDFCVLCHPLGYGQGYITLDDAVYFLSTYSTNRDYSTCLLLSLAAECIERRFYARQEASQDNADLFYSYDKTRFLLSENNKCSSKNGYIYLFESNCTQLLKLGFSTDVKSTLTSLSRWDGELSLIASKRSSLDKEQYYHRCLKKHGLYYGQEWYPLDRKEEILNLVFVKPIGTGSHRTV